MDVDQLSARKKQTALHIACAKNQTDIASYLISVNASLKICDHTGKMPYDLCTSIDLKRLINQAITKYNLNIGLMEEADFENNRLIKQAKDNDNGIFQIRENGSSSNIGHQMSDNKYPTNGFTQDTNYSTDDSMNNYDNIMHPQVGIPLIDKSTRSPTRNSINISPKRMEPQIMNSPITNSTTSFDLDDFDAKINVTTNVENRNEKIDNINMNDFEDDDD